MSEGSREQYLNEDGGTETGILLAEKDAKPKIYVEVGSGYRPFAASRFHKVYSNERYYVVETAMCGKAKEHKSALAVQKQGRGEVYKFIYANGKNLPFRDHSVNEVVFNSVFGDPSVMGDLSRRYERIYPLLDEAVRILESGGKIVITEVTEDIFPSDKLMELITRKYPNLDIQETKNDKAISEYFNVSPDEMKSFTSDRYQIVLTAK